MDLERRNTITQSSNEFHNIDVTSGHDLAIFRSVSTK
jgi:hypothetical protein